MNITYIKTGRWIWMHLPRFVRKWVWKGFLWSAHGKQIIKTVDGITFDLDMGEVIDVGIYLHKFEREVTGFIDVACQKGYTVLDVGANIGAHCLRFAKIVGVEGAVYAFEPTDYAFSKLQKNIALNQFGNIKAFRVALANQNLYQQEIFFRSSWRYDGSQLQVSSMVDFVRLDDWAAKNFVDRVDIIKIDVDGNEYSVFDGGRRLLDKFKPIVIAEVGAWHFTNSEFNPWSILADMGYSFWDLITKKKYATLQEMRDRLPKEDPEMGFSINIVAKVGSSPWPGEGEL